MNKTPCFSPAHILLPSEQIPVGQWGCVACDQFTSDRSYWEKAAQAAAGSPSTLDLILPEVYLEEDDVDARISAIHAAMDDYTRNVLTRAVVTGSSSQLGAPAAQLGVKNLLVKVPSSSTLDAAAREELTLSLTEAGVEHVVIRDDAASYFE